MQRTDRVALITGSSSGIGKAIAVRLATEGYNVCVNFYADETGARETVRQVEGVGRRAIAIRADVADVAEIYALVDRCVAELGGLDVMVNNAAMAHRASILDVIEADWDRVVDVALKGVFFGLQAAARHMVHHDGGRIVNISSIHEDAVMAGMTPYCAAKGGVRMLMRNAAVELARHNITVNNVAPGAIATRASSPALADPAVVAELHEVIPLGRAGTPEDVAAVVAFLVSPDAAYITGSTYYVDGGMIRHFTDK
jgi:glucose 1-dehydrogenase